MWCVFCLIHAYKVTHVCLFYRVGFRTKPMDSTGVAHILEHTVLCGSRKYPVRDPFFKMMNRSLATFMNAYTGVYDVRRYMCFCALWAAFPPHTWLPGSVVGVRVCPHVHTCNYWNTCIPSLVPSRLKVVVEHLVPFACACALFPDIPKRYLRYISDYVT